MIDLIDPVSAPLWAVWLFAASFYPLAFMLGGGVPWSIRSENLDIECGGCCMCNVCRANQLPDTVTVTLDNMPSRRRGPDLFTVEVVGCFGYDGRGRIESPGGEPESAGPIAEVVVTNPGQGYAKMARVEPTVTTQFENLTVTLEQDYELCSDYVTQSSVPYWKVVAIDVSEGVSGVTDGQSIEFHVAEGDTEEQPATASIITVAEEPSLTASAPGGEGAVLAVTVSKIDGQERWEVASVGVTSGGSGYTDGDPITITLGEDDVEQSAAYAVLYTQRSEPTLTASVGGPGEGAVLSVTLSQQTEEFTGRPYWEVSGITVESGGEGYQQDQAVLIESGDHTVVFSLLASINVDEDGAITSVTVDYGGIYFVGSSVIESVQVLSGGSYYRDSGDVASITITSEGKYYREDPEGEPYVADVTVSIGAQTLPSDGDGAELGATIDDDPESPTFGQVTAITVVNGGDGYLGWKWNNAACCDSHYNGKSFVLKQLSVDDYQLPKQLFSGSVFELPECRYRHEFCGVGNLNGPYTGYIEVAFNGPGKPPVVQVVSEDPLLSTIPSDVARSSLCNFTASADDAVDDCEDFSFVATGPDGQTATVVPGGEYDADFLNPGGKSCFICCKGDEELPDEITVSVAGVALAGIDGDYVLTLGTAGCPQAPFTSSTAARQCYASWDAPPFVFSEVDDLCRLNVRLELCSLQANLNTGFSSLVENPSGEGDIVSCDDCHEKCFTAVYLGVADFSNFCVSMSSRIGAFLDPENPFGGRQFQHCDTVCEPTPQCGPKAGTYTIRRFGYESDEILATVTIS